MHPPLNDYGRAVIAAQDAERKLATAAIRAAEADREAQVAQDAWWKASGAAAEADKLVTELVAQVAELRAERDRLRLTPAAD